MLTLNVMASGEEARSNTLQTHPSTWKHLQDLSTRNNSQKKPNHLDTTPPPRPSILEASF
ncbi:hypothetical protein LEMLEM_LOCUS8032 [Lemmus lemmus]